MNLRSTIAFLCALICISVNFVFADDPVVPAPQEPKVAEASREAQDALAGFQLPEGWRAEVFAAEPNVANIVAFTLDRLGRAYVAESFRQNVGVTDNRGHDEEWLRADLSAKTVADRIAYHQRLLGKKGVDECQSQDDRIRLVEDTDGDGIADRSTVYAAGFNRLEDGTGAGVLEYGGSVYYTCIPKLWKFMDKDGDGKSDQRVALHDGYGVRVAFRGHDMHGLILGPDGRVYFSIGDRGYHVTTKEGKTLSDPSSGAVFRCELDGSNLEVFATGLRNPQELAFDQWGNLFTGDNNSDGGDKARWVYVVEGGDTGWRMEYQYIPDRGPFNREKIWHPFHPEQPAYIVPPVENVADGPSGLIYYPGTGLGDKFENAFLLADFRGTPNQSGIRTIRVEPNGAHFKLSGNEKLVWNILATDLALSSDGGLYISDWVDGWNGTGKGRIYRFNAGKDAHAVEIEEVKSLLQGDWSKQSVENLKLMLGHKDQRVRQESQFELVRRSQVDALTQIASNGNTTAIARVHGIWGLGQLARQQPKLRDQVLSPLVALLKDKELQVRAACCLVLGDNRFEKAGAEIAALIGDSEARVAHYAAIACAKLNWKTAFQKAVDLLEKSDNKDPVLRHAAVMALVGTQTSDGQIAMLKKHASSAVRLGAVVALRRMKSTQLESFLGDENSQVVAEAIRAIHDMPVEESLPAIANLLTRDGLDEESAFRCLNAAYRLGEITLVANYAANKSAPERLRVEAIKMLAKWTQPDERDRYLNAWRPIEQRGSKQPTLALSSIAQELIGGSEPIQLATISALVDYRMSGQVDALMSLTSGKTSPKVRSEAMKAISKIDKARAKTLIEPMLADTDWQVSAAALEVLAEIEPARAAAGLSKALQSPELEARQAAWSLARKLSDQEAAKLILEKGVTDYLAGKLAHDEWLDLLEASEGKLSASVAKQLDDQQQKWQEQDAVDAWRWALAGGDAKRGREVFFYKSSVSCLRCHKVGNQGGEVGPALTDLGAKKDARYLLEAIVLPSAKIAEGFESITLVDDVGTLHTGVLKKETDEFVEYMTAEGKLVRVEKETIEDRRKGNSAMPADLTKQLSKKELRDLVAYLVSLKGGDKNEGH